jgi:hypothetical protein
VVKIDACKLTSLANTWILDECRPTCTHEKCKGDKVFGIEDKHIFLFKSAKIMTISYSFKVVKDAFQQISTWNCTPFLLLSISVPCDQVFSYCLFLDVRLRGNSDEVVLSWEKASRRAKSRNYVL